MASVKKIENGLADVFKGLPKLPESSKDSLVKIWPWIALVGGILQIFAAYSLWKLVHYTNAVIDYVNQTSIYLTGKSIAPTGGEKFVVYLGIIMLLAEGVIMIMAYSPMKSRLRRGWDLVFLATLLNVVYAVVQVFTYHRGFGSFLGNLFGSAIGFYLLFQVRDRFAKSRV